VARLDRLWRFLRHVIALKKKSSKGLTPLGTPRKIKGKKTKDIWYYEHTLPEGAKAYNKTKPIRIEEFDTLKKWWKKRDKLTGVAYAENAV
jgi:hypothetical protein